MAYRISYGAEKVYNPSGTLHPVRIALMSVFCGALFLSMAHRYWPEGARVMDRLLSFDGWAGVKEALEAMTLDLRSGTRLQDAVTAFCQDVVSGSLSFGS